MTPPADWTPLPETVEQCCTLGVGCDEAGVCYADAHNQPERCGRIAANRLAFCRAVLVRAGRLGDE